jgi:hypothetical protein
MRGFFEALLRDDFAHSQHHMSVAAISAKMARQRLATDPKAEHVRPVINLRKRRTHDG